MIIKPPPHVQLRLRPTVIAAFTLALALLVQAVAAGDNSSSVGNGTVPDKLVVAAASTSTITLTWEPLKGAERYFVIRSPEPPLVTTLPRLTIESLPCGTSFTFGVATRADAPPPQQATVTGSTAQCAGAAAGATVPPTAAPASGDAQAPAVPSMFTVNRSTSSTLTVSWGASTDNVGVAGYGLYLDGKLVSTTTGTGFEYQSLACGASQRIAVDAFDAAGNRSARNERTVSTEPCTAGSTTEPTAQPPIAARGGDNEAPTVPQWFTVRRSTSTTLTVDWRSSTDNVGVAGYGLYLNGERVSTTKSTGFVYESLACGASQQIAVDSFDAAGNRSPRNVRVVSTEPCSSGAGSSNGGSADTQAPTAPEKVTRTSATATSVTIAWSPATDNVGVAGYGLYKNGTRVSTSGGSSAYFGALQCGSSITLGVDAFDAAGNRSRRVDLTTATDPCPAVAPTSCDRVAQPGAGTANTLLASLAAGQVGCLRGGVYTASSVYVLDVSKSGVTIRSYPGERAVLRGIVVVRSGANGSRLAHVSVAGNGTQNTIQVYGADFVLEDSDITNEWRGRSCLMLGDTSAGTAVRPVVRGNRFHECGSLANGNKDHAIYANQVVDGRITDNRFWNAAAYAIQLYPNAQRTLVSHNTIDGGSPSVRGGIIFGGEGSSASRDNVVEYNVIAYSATYNIEAWWGGSVGSGNIARSNCVYGGGSGNIAAAIGFVSQGNVVAPPQFADRAGHDYTLLSGSPCTGVVQ